MIDLTEWAFHEPLKWNNMVSYVLIIGAVYFSSQGYLAFSSICTY